MSEFLATYGLWLLIALLVIIAVVFLMSWRKKDASSAIAAASAKPVVPEAVSPPPPVAEPVTLSGGAAATTVVPIPEAAAAASPPPSETDNLLLLKGVGPKLNSLLIELGVTSFAQIAGWNDTDLAAIDAKLGTFKGRPVRDHWIDQAKYLAAGDTAGFEAKYGKL